MKALLRDLRTQAMLGTERAGEEVRARGALGDAFRAVDATVGAEGPDERAAALLSRIALASAYTLAGAEPPSSRPCDTAAVGPDTRPRLNARAQRHLAQLLRDVPYTDVLPAWLEAAAAAGVGPPARALPALLDAASRQPGIARTVMTVTGARGRWLARQNPAWNRLAEDDAGDGPPDPDQLAHASHAERVAAMRTWRALDPAAARRWLETALDAERARERAGLVATLEVGLGPSDEPLLEARLDDRAKDVRALACRLLARLPKSALVQRMEARAASHVSWYVQPEGFAEIVVQLPRKLHEDARRDGVSELAIRGTGRRATWLRRFLEVVPPERWSERWAATPAQIVQAAAHSDWADLILGAFGDACALHPSPDWAIALLTERLTYEPNLWAQLPLDQAEPLLGRWLTRQGRTGSPARALAEVGRLGGDWSPKFSRAVATSIRASVERAEAPSHGLMRDLLRACSMRMSPAAHDAVRDQLLGSLEPNPWTPSFERLVQVLGFRAAMLLELDRSKQARQA